MIPKCCLACVHFQEANYNRINGPYCTSQEIRKSDKVSRRKQANSTFCSIVLPVFTQECIHAGR